MPQGMGSCGEPGSPTSERTQHIKESNSYKTSNKKVNQENRSFHFARLFTRC